MLQLSTQQLNELLTFPKAVKILEKAFQGKITVPLRHHHQYENPAMGADSTLLLMPAWKSGAYLGIKIVTVSPKNGNLNLPAIQGLYLLFDAKTGVPVAQMDAKLLTVKRTAAASALASSFLSRKESSTLLMIGTGALAPHLIAAHASIRPIEKVLVWGRDRAKAQMIVEQSKNEQFTIQTIEHIEEGMEKADIISCATLSTEPLIFGKWLKKGQHIDLVGSYLPHAREADDEVIIKATIFVDTMEGATKESGDIVIPLQKGILRQSDIPADLFDLCQGKHTGRQSPKEITVFKSVGHGLEDLATAVYLYEAVKEQEN